MSKNILTFLRNAIELNNQRNGIGKHKITLSMNTCINIGVVGWRGYDKYTEFKELLGNAINCIVAVDKEIRIISGGCKGTDTMAIQYAIEKRYDYKVYYPKLNKYGSPAAYHIRNHKIAAHSNIIIAFVSEKSKGTRSTIKIANNLKKRVHVINI